MADPDQFRVSPSLQGLPRLDAPAVESNTPAMLVRTGQAVQRAGVQGSEIYQQVLREQNATRVSEALLQATEKQHQLTYDPDTGWASQLGKNALERPNGAPLDDEIGGQFEDFASNIENSLGNDAQRRLFRERVNAMSVDLRGRVQSHVATQGFNYRKETLTGLVGSGQRLMGSATDPIDMARAADMTRQAAMQLADMTGMADEAREDFYREQLTPGHMGALGRMTASEDIEGAEDYFNQYRDEITYEAATRIEGALLEQRALVEGREIGEAIATGTQAVAAARAPQDVGMPVVGAASYTRTGRFGENRGTHRHGGIDWAMPQGTAVHAGADGVARIKRDPDGYGLYVDLVLDNGTTLRMAHLSDTEVEDGQRVSKGTVIARSGSSGRSTGPHLHYEVIGADGAKVDPLEWHQGRPQTQGTNGPMPSTRAAALEALRLRDLPPRQHAEAERAINSYFSAQREAEAEQKDEVLSRAYANIDRTGTFSSADRAAITAAGLGSSIPSLRSFEEAVTDRRAGGTVSEEKALINYGIARQMIAEGKITTAEDLLPLWPGLTDSYYKQLIDDVTGSPTDARRDADSVVSMMNEEIEATGLFEDEDGKPDKNKMAGLLGSITRQIEQERAQGPVSTARQREIVLGMIGRDTITELGVRPAGWRIRQYYDSVPAAERSRITRELQRAGDPNPSQAQVVSSWLRTQRR